ncbi:MAG: L,D-transpeptidase family protein, partial [Sphingomonas sp.]|nr:L,D-transpeptidase family protein [Sphingomonas sp.]
MKKLALALAVSGVLALGVPTMPATAAIETYEAKMTAASAAAMAREDMYEAFGPKQLKSGQYLWRDVRESEGELRVVVGLSDQLAFLYRGDTLVAVSTISSGTAETPTPTGIFNVLEKKPMHHSRKYDNAPMPHMQRIDEYGVALHAGFIPGHPASHGCVRLPAKFAAKLFSVTDVGTPI